MEVSAIVTFDLKDAISDDYLSMREQLNNYGLYPYVIGEGNIKVDLPTTMYVGKYSTKPLAEQLKNWLFDSARYAEVAIGKYFVFSKDGQWSWKGQG